MENQKKVDLPCGFYSAQPQERTRALRHATIELRNHLMAGLPDWPMFSPGTINAWLVFLGASPGNSPGGPWNYDPLPSIGGTHPGVAEYVDANGFWNGIRQYACATFPELDPADTYAATMVRNLVPEQSATAPSGKRMKMNMAAVQVTEILGRLIRPRMVIAIGGAREYTNQAFRQLADIKCLDSGVLYTAKAGEERSWFSLKGKWDGGFPFMYLSPKGIHPSRRQVSQEDTLSFLSEQSKAARAL